MILHSTGLFGRFLFTYIGTLSSYKKNGYLRNSFRSGRSFILTITGRLHAPS
ncbi:hypothetical protein SAMN05444162_0609 [Paenibacillaceae bacterium GAS479]|nr:hypothetical protein SAMN05444162_0609 [Paenibacillaceae bacterium GAS479]